MQLKNPKSENLMSSWKLAATTLITSLPIHSHAAPAEDEWEVDASILYYGEIDRVTAIAPLLDIQHNWSAEKSLSANFVFDALAGASHNGAAVVDSVQTFTGSSGGGEHDDDDEEEDDSEGSNLLVFQPGEVPLITGFEDKRFATQIAYRSPFKNPLHTYSTGVSFSYEEDYLSLGANAGLGWEFNQRNTQLNLGINGNLDRINPIGGMPTPLEIYDEPSARNAGSDYKQVFETSSTLTQILSRTMISQLKYSAGWINGYLDDPYKIVSLLDSDGVPVDYLNESRPNSRFKQSIGVAIKVALGAHSATSDYRYYWDDWSIHSHTLDQKIRFNISDQWFIEGHGRWYQQSKADFYTLYIQEGDSPAHASADYRLGDLFTQTYGINVGYRLDIHQTVSWRTEWYNQKDPETDNKAANMSAIITQLNYSLKF